mgnify:CR=1 FL=1
MKVLLLLMVFLLTACASQTHKPEKRIEISEAEKEAWVAEVRQELRDRGRLELVSSRILIKGMDYCRALDHTAPYLGIRLGSNQGLQPEWQEVALTRLNLGSEPQVLQVIPSSPADSAGLEINDRILEVNGSVAKTVSDTLKMINEAAATDKPVTFTLRRASNRLVVSVTPTMACKSRVLMVHNNMIDTAIDGETIQITSGLLQFAQSDEEIAAIISHQLAHNARKHVRTNKIIGGLGGILVGAMGFAGDIGLALLSGGSYATSGFTQLGWAAGNAMAGGMSANQFQQADKDSLYVMASAGYGIDNVPVFWQRVQELNEPEGINALRNSHPFLPERSLAMEAAQKEIKEKIQNGNSPYALNF